MTTFNPRLIEERREEIAFWLRLELDAMHDTGRDCTDHDLGLLLNVADSIEAGYDGQTLDLLSPELYRCPLGQHIADTLRGLFGLRIKDWRYVDHPTHGRDGALSFISHPAACNGVFSTAGYAIDDIVDWIRHCEV